MKVILLADVKSVGKKGETVTVELYEAPAAGGSGTTDTNTGDNTGEGEEGTGN